MRKLFLSIIGVLLFHCSIAQVNSLMSMDEFNRLFFNPAAIGNTEYINVNMVSRHQWIGMPDSPTTQFVSVSNFFDKYNSNLGLSIINDNLGAESTQNLKLNYAFLARINKKTYFTFGLGSGVIFRGFNSGNTILERSDDPQQYSSDFSKTNLDFDFGIEFTSNNFKVGFGSNHIANAYNKYTEIRIPNHNYWYLKYKAEFNKETALNMGGSLSQVGNIYQATLFSTLVLKDKVNAGIAYRLNESVILMTQIQISKNLLLGYAYDIGAGSIRKFNSGSHEILLIGRFRKSNQRSYQSPRFFD